MAESPERNQRTPQAWGNYILGLFVFLVGISLMLLAFAWGFTALGTLDEQLNQVTQVKAATTPATVAAPAKPKPGSAAKPATPKPDVVQAEPPKEEGPSLGKIATVAGLRLLTLLVLAGIGAMVATRGAQLAHLSLH